MQKFYASIISEIQESRGERSMANVSNNKVTMPSDKDYIVVLITTENYIIKGKLYLPENSVVKNPTNENLLFYTLNCGNMFISLHDCTIMNKTSVEFKPEEVDYYNINLNIVHSCQIMKDEV